MGRPKKYPDELVQRGVRLALEGDRPIAHIAHDLGMHPETLRMKLPQAEADGGRRTDLFLRDDSRPVHEVFRHMKRGYNARSALANGGQIDELKFADGTPAILAEYVDRISDYMPSRFNASPVRRPTGRACRRATGTDTSSARCPRRGCGAAPRRERIALQESWRDWRPSFCFRGSCERLVSRGSDDRNGRSARVPVPVGLTTAIAGVCRRLATHRAYCSGSSFARADPVRGALLLLPHCGSDDARARSHIGALARRRRAPAPDVG
jgi:hypothetical protein